MERVERQRVPAQPQDRREPPPISPRRRAAATAAVRRRGVAISGDVFPGLRPTRRSSGRGEVAERYNQPAVQDPLAALLGAPFGAQMKDPQ